MKKILLIGIDGLYNYGCEAIVRGTESILHSQWPDAQILYASSRPDDDTQRLLGCNVQIVPRLTYGKYSYENFKRKLLSYCGLKYLPCYDNPKQALGVDAVFCIGGDIWNLYPDGSYNANLPKLGSRVMKMGIPFILWGASIGPFSRNPSAEQFFKKNLSNISLITAREKDTVDYLSYLGITSNVIYCADPAYIVASGIIKNIKTANNKKLIGINLSPLSLGSIKSDKSPAILEQAQMVERIIKVFDANVILIPHVVCEFAEWDDDLRYLQQLKSKINSLYQNNVTIVEADPRFIDIKNILIKCDLVIAARMHCCINAISAFVPTLFVSYSQKSQGMCEYIYNNRDYVVKLSDFCSDNCLEKIGIMLNNQIEVQSYLAQRMSVVKLDCYKPLSRLSLL